MAIHDGHRERMRKQLKTSGMDSLSDVQVLEVLLYYAAPRGDTNPAAHALLNRFGTLDGCLPEFVLAALREAFPLFDKKLRGYAMPDAVLTGVETRSSSPVRIVRGETGQSNLRGVYPCGEGAGYAGGILSAAVDGIRQAENWLSQHME